MEDFWERGATIETWGLGPEIPGPKITKPGSPRPDLHYSLLDPEAAEDFQSASKWCEVSVATDAPTGKRHLIILPKLATCIFRENLGNQNATSMQYVSALSISSTRKWQC